MATLDVRTARDEDLEVLVTVFGQERFFADRLRHQRAGRGDLLVAWQGSEPVGDGFLMRDLPEEAQGGPAYTPAITHLEVRPTHQGRGVGTALIAEAERIAGAHGYHRICLGVGIDNPDARRLYERLGFEEWSDDAAELGRAAPDTRGIPHQRAETCQWLIKNIANGAPSVDNWQAWSPAEAAQHLRRAGLTDIPWYVAGGWAVDLHIGRITREHEDLEVAIPRACFGAWRAALSAYRLYDVGVGRVRELGPAAVPDPANHQVWLRDGDVWRMDTFLESGDARTWVCHRDARIRVPFDDAVTHNPEGLPYLRPQFVLMGKAKHRRPKDEADLVTLLPTLDLAARRWLAAALSTVHPGHPWIFRTIRGA